MWQTVIHSINHLTQRNSSRSFMSRNIAQVITANVSRVYVPMLCESKSPTTNYDKAQVPPASQLPKHGLYHMPVQTVKCI